MLLERHDKVLVTAPSECGNSTPNSLAGTLPTPGAINSLQLLSIPKGSLDGTRWAPSPSDSSNEPHPTTTSNANVADSNNKTTPALDRSLTIQRRAIDPSRRRARHGTSAGEVVEHQRRGSR
ncbi:hypothetical protein HYDPIDRAFT_35184 [Hydnomerulius pinastri MD-312]|nr:hypothetical protein HYDPIDRAFT_35184 [Hydnomerulius pinastri MD-312]